MPSRPPPGWQQDRSGRTTTWCSAPESADRWTGATSPGRSRRSARRPFVNDAAKRVPYEMRHTHASLMSDSGVAAEEVAQQLGHSGTRVFEMVYRHVLKPRRRTGQYVMETIIAGSQTG